jgi:hypothetical protein
MSIVTNVIGRVVKAVVTFGIIFAIMLSVTFAYAFVIDGDTPWYIRTLIVVILAITIAHELVPARKQAKQPTEGSGHAYGYGNDNVIH